MFACLYSLSAPQSLLVNVAQDFTPRFETIGPLVMLDIAGLSRLFGSPRTSASRCAARLGGAAVRIAIAPSQTAAALLALGRVGLTVVSLEEQPARLAPLPVALLGRGGELAASRWATVMPVRPSRATGRPCRDRARTCRHTSRRWKTSSPYFQSCLERASDAATAPHADCALDMVRAPHSNCGGGWSHPRDSHARQARRVRADRPGHV